MGVGEEDLVDDELQCVQDEELGGLYDGEFDSYGTGKGTRRKVWFKSEVVAFRDCEFR